MRAELDDAVVSTCDLEDGIVVEAGAHVLG